MPTSSQSVSYAPPSYLRSRLHALAAPLRAAEPHAGAALLVTALVIVTFAVDLLLPLGIAGGIPYVAPVLVTMWLPARRYTLPVAALCTLLIGAGFLLSPAGAPLWAVLPNRALAALAVWVVALLALERSRIEQALAGSEERVHAVLATTADGILTVEEGGRIASANAAAARIFGVEEAALAGRSFGGLLGPADRALFEHDPPAFLSAAAAEVPAHEVVGRRSDSSCFPAELALVPLSQGAAARYTVTVRDVSERRRLEQRLLHASEEERRALGHDLHEELGQTLTGLSLISRQLARRLEDRHPDEAREAADLAALLHEADGLVLRLFEAVVPVDARGGLAEALSRLIQDTAAEQRLLCSVEHAGALPALDALHAAQLYRIVQDLVGEALSDRGIGHLSLRIGGGGRHEGALHLRLTGTHPLASEALEGVLRSAKHRAQLIGKRLQLSRPTPHDLVVSCTW